MQKRRYISAVTFAGYFGDLLSIDHTDLGMSQPNQIFHCFAGSQHIIGRYIALIFPGCLNINQRAWDLAVHHFFVIGISCTQPGYHDAA